MKTPPSARRARARRGRTPRCRGSRSPRGTGSTARSRRRRSVSRVVEEHLARVVDGDVHLRVVEHARVHRRAARARRARIAGSSSTTSTRSIDGACASQPADAAGPQADDHGALRGCGTRNAAEQPAHHLRLRVANRGAVDLAVDHERDPAPVLMSATRALEPVGLPHEQPPLLARSNRARRSGSRCGIARPAPIGAVAPRRRRAGRADRDEREHADRRRAERADRTRVRARARAASATAPSTARTTTTSRQQPGAESAGISPKPPASAPTIAPTVFAA